jgi:Uma2 family endonuclease
MTTDTQTGTLRIVRAIDGLDLTLEPLQGSWTEEQYLKLTNQTNHLIEFTDGVIEVLPMPTRDHQVILAFLYELLLLWLRPQGGKVLFAPLRVHVRPGKFREPDVLVLQNAQDPRNQNAYWLGADLVIEIVSPDDPERDTVEKVADYAEAGIPEYWIVNPLNETITVLMLAGTMYTEHGVFQRGDHATSKLLNGFSVNVDAVFDAK